MNKTRRAATNKGGTGAAPGSNVKIKGLDA
jgi:hypothetical protein